MKSLWDNIIQKFFCCFVLCICWSVSIAEEIDPTDVSYVSINPYTNEVTVCWYKSESANIAKARILYIYDETTLIKGKGIADISGNEDVTFKFKTDTIAMFSYEANEKSLSFAVDAYSENGNNSTSLREYHSTMIATARTTRCPSKIKISWNAYFGYEISVDSYEIVEVVNNSEVVVAQCSGKETTCLVELNENLNRSFFVRASFVDCRGKKQCSTSSMCSVSEKTSKLPQFIDIENVTIDMADIVLNCKLDVSSDFRTYVFYKAKNDKNSFVAIDTINLQTTSSQYFTYVDADAYKKDTTNYYKVSVFDNCGTELLSSQIVTPLKIHLLELDELQNRIEWNDESLVFDEFVIWRQVNGGQEEPLQIISTDQNSFVDDMHTNYKSNFSQCYRLEAKKTIGEKTYSSFSDVVCVEKPYKLLIPNAFNPFSDELENQEFKPKYAFLSGEYKMEVFDRFGTCIFTSNDINKGWDGIHKGSNAPTGMYHYKILILLPNGEKIERTGSVHLIYN